MYKTTAQLKIEAKKAMAPQQANIILMMIVPVVISAIINFIHRNYYNDLLIQLKQNSLVTSLYDNTLNSNFNLTQFTSFVIPIIVGFMTIAIIWRLLTVFRNPNETTVSPIGDITKRLNNPDLFTIIMTAVSKYLFILLWAIIPTTVGTVTIFFSTMSKHPSIGGTFLGTLFILFGIIISYVKTLNYSLAYFLAYDEMKRTGGIPDFTYGISASKELMKGQNGRLFWLYLTFILWYFLNGITCGLSSIYAMPYIELTKIAFYEELLEKRSANNEY
ncbi:MAG: DUF975 family protein [Lactobacillales bacterium]|jgi:uncharacterized membrane protein|nr:DUF975 family protein [Lactobacillales bacterium]